ncbi:hypothetical protein V7149_01600 [Bacillus sp. JJ1503]|uniref:hypothetical protein n=1 Tax=Bacillus sp. JJ1503 TaxID=3122956 RepID=UPI003000BEAC
MDFEKIYSESLSKAINKSIQSIFEKDSSESEKLKLSDPELYDEVQGIKLMQKFSAQVAIETVKLYHEELTQKLKKHGINIDELD